MQAFAKDSANMAIGGSGPVNKNLDFDKFHGRGAEGFTDYSTSGTVNPVSDGPYEPNGTPTSPSHRLARPATTTTWTGSFDPVSRADQVHGEESLGLGTSTFLDGAPAPRAAIQRRESETETTGGTTNGGGLGRKRSLAQKIRGINNSWSERHGGAPRIASPEYATSPPQQTQSAGGMPRIREIASGSNANPFFNDYDEAYEKKGSKIQIAERERQQQRGTLGRSGSIGGGKEEFNTSSARVRAMSSPKREGRGILERRITGDGTGNGTTSGEISGGGGGSLGGVGSGFLNRVKSLKGGKRNRPE